MRPYYKPQPSTVVKSSVSSVYSTIHSGHLFLLLSFDVSFSGLTANPSVVAPKSRIYCSIAYVGLWFPKSSTHYLPWSFTSLTLHAVCVYMCNKQQTATQQQTAEGTHHHNAMALCNIVNVIHVM